MMAVVEILKAFLFVAIVGGTAYYWGLQRGRRNRLTVAQIHSLRSSIEASYPAQFVGQFMPNNFAELVDRRLNTLLEYSKNPMDFGWRSVPAASSRKTLVDTDPKYHDGSYSR